MSESINHAAIFVITKHDGRNEILLMKEKGGKFDGKWSTPGGGKKAEDKSIYAIAEREFTEETGNILDVNKLLNIDKNPIKFLLNRSENLKTSTYGYIYYVPDKTKFIVKRSSEHSDDAWFSLDDISSLHKEYEEKGYKYITKDNIPSTLNMTYYCYNSLKSNMFLLISILKSL